MNNNIVLDALDYYYKRREEFRDTEIIITNETSELMPVAIVNGKKMRYNLLGIIDENETYFMWAWRLNIEKIHYIKTKHLLMYGVNIDVKTKRDAYIKRLLTSNTLDIKNSNNLILIVALALYLTKANSLIINRNSPTYSSIYGLYDINDIIT